MGIISLIIFQETILIKQENNQFHWVQIHINDYKIWCVHFDKKKKKYKWAVFSFHLIIKIPGFLKMVFSTIVIVILASVLLGNPLVRGTVGLTVRTVSLLALSDCSSGQLLNCEWIGDKDDGEEGSKALCNSLCNMERPGCKEKCTWTCKNVNCFPHGVPRNQRIRTAVFCYSKYRENGRVIDQYKELCDCTIW